MQGRTEDMLCLRVDQWILLHSYQLEGCVAEVYPVMLQVVQVVEPCKNLKAFFSLEVFLLLFYFWS